MQQLGLNPEPDPSAQSADLSFDQPAPLAPAEQPARVCPRCGNPVVENYYATATQEVLCVSCGETALAAIPPGPGARGILRALLFGSGAAFLGMIVYFIVLATTGYEIGYLAIGVGWLVGRAVRHGGFGRGGRKLQWIAVGLTYLSITGSYLVLGIKELASGKQASAVAAKSNTGQVKGAATDPPKDAKNESEPQGPVTFGQFLVALVMLFFLTLAIPFMGGFSNILGLLIIAFGLFEAWRINRKPPPEVTGPFSLNASA
ncbi:MAG: hypothetical protein U0Q16_15990 [Bryobacteraceae bacterium]